MQVLQEVHTEHQILGFKRVSVLSQRVEVIPFGSGLLF